MKQDFEPRLESVAEPRKPVSTGRTFSSLRSKGHLFNILLISYIAFISLYVLNQRHQPLQQLEQYQKIQKAQEALVQADLAAFHLVTVLFSDVSQTDLKMVVGYFFRLTRAVHQSADLVSRAG